jgi:hypothetical protein
MGLFRRNKVWWMTFIHQGQQVRTVHRDNGQAPRGSDSRESTGEDC